MEKLQKLSKSQNSKVYLEKKYKVQSEIISKEIQKKLEEASQNANEKIQSNNTIYQQSNAHSHENFLRKNSFYETDEELGIPERSEEELIEYKRLIGMPITEDYDELIESLITPRRVLKKENGQNYN